MIVVIQSHATPLIDGSLKMSDLAREPMHADWSSITYLLLNMSRSGGWSALAYMGGFDDTRGASPYGITYREAFFFGFWAISGFKWTLWFLPAFVYMRVLFVVAHRCGLMRLHMLLLSQLWLTVPMFVDWYVGWHPVPKGEATVCPAQCFCPFEGRRWVESIAFDSVGMWTVVPAMISHSFVGRALFFVPCYWLGFYTGRPAFRWLGKINDEFSWRQRLLTAALAGGLYLFIFTRLNFIEGGFDDSCGSFWHGDQVVWMQLVKNVGFYMENIVTSALYVVVVVALVPVHLQRLAKTSFPAYVVAAFPNFFSMMDLPAMALQIRHATDLPA